MTAGGGLQGPGAKAAGSAFVFDHLVDAFRSVWAEPSRAATIALCDDRERIAYGDLSERVGRLSGSLRAAGIGTGDRVAIAMERSARQAVAIVATMVAGACPCPLEPRLSREEVTRRHALARIDWTLVDTPRRGDPALADVPRSRLLAIDELPVADAWWTRALTPLSPAFLLFTSGSSGVPKGVLQSHRGLLVNALGIVDRTGLAATDRLLHVMPLHHTNGVNNQILAPLLAGSSVHLAPRFRAEEMPALMDAIRPTIVTGVPTMYARMLTLDFAPGALAALRMLRCGSAPLTLELQHRVQAKFGHPLIVSYGLSEATCTSTMNPPDAHRPGSVGTALPGQDVYLDDGDGTRLAAPGEGEICIAGPSLMLGYLTDASRGTPEPPGPVVRTGDLGRFDEDGYLFVTGRQKDIIIRGGENLSPATIERALGEASGVAACCVVARPDADLGEVPVAFVVRAPSDAGATLEAEHLAEAVATRLGRTHRPALVVFVAALPENGVGKIDRKALRAVAADPSFGR